MKVFVLTFTLALILLYSTLINSNIVAAQTRRNAIDQALRLSLYQTLQEVKMIKLSGIESEEEMKADFLKNFAENIDQDGEFKIAIINIDLENGLLDVVVTNSYLALNGENKEIKIRKTILYEEKDDQ